MTTRSLSPTARTSRKIVSKTGSSSVEYLENNCCSCSSADGGGGGCGVAHAGGASMVMDDDSSGWDLKEETDCSLSYIMVTKSLSSPYSTARPILHYHDRRCTNSPMVFM
mgnify:CR=1 FL=1